MNLFRILIVILIAVTALLVFQQMEYIFRIIIILTAIIAFLAFRLSKGAKKNTGMGWAIFGIIALVLGLIGTGWTISVMDPHNFNFIGLFISLPLIVIGILAVAIAARGNKLKE